MSIDEYFTTFHMGYIERLISKSTDDADDGAEAADGTAPMRLLLITTPPSLVDRAGNSQIRHKSEPSHNKKKKWKSDFSIKI